MKTHLGMMALFALLVSIVFAALGRHDGATKKRLGVRLFVGLLVGGCALGWVLYGVFGRA
ncbi:hypothetical protein D3C83_277960 [compost metagenome]